MALSQNVSPKFIYNLDGRAGVASAYIEIPLAALAARGGFADIDLPIGAEVIGGHINVTDASDAGTTDTVSLGDAGNATRYLAATNVKATGKTALANTAGFITTQAAHSVRVTRATTGTAATKGTIRVYVQYAELGKADWPQGGQGFDPV